MSLKRYVEAAMPDTTVICCLVLKPFSVGHYLWLSKYKSPFICDDERMASPKDFFFALSVCARSYEDFGVYINDPEVFEAENKQWDEILKKKIASTKDWNLFDQQAIFKDYINRAMQMPRWWEEGKSGGKKSSSHWSQDIVEALVTKGNRTESQVHNMHLAQAFEAWAKLVEESGAISLWTDKDYEDYEKKQTVQVSDWDKLLAAHKEKQPCPA